MFLAEVAALSEHGFIRVETHATFEAAEGWIARVVAETSADLRFDYVSLIISDIPTGDVLHEDMIGLCADEGCDGDYDESWGTNFDLNSET